MQLERWDRGREGDAKSKAKRLGYEIEGDLAVNYRRREEGGRDMRE
jgi:hypothetical protein